MLGEGVNSQNVPESRFKSFLRRFSKRQIVSFSIIIGMVLLGATAVAAQRGYFKTLADAIHYATLEIEVKNQQGSAFGEGIIVTVAKQNKTVAWENTKNTTENGVIKSIATLQNLDPNTTYQVNAHAAGCDQTENFSTGVLYSITRKSLTLICGNQSSGQTYNLVGYVRNSKTNQIIQGANVLLVGSSLSTTTYSSGYYALKNIPLGSLSELTLQQFKFSATGYSEKTLTLRQIGISPESLSAGQSAGGTVVTLDPASTSTQPQPTPATNIDQSKFTLVGKVTDESGKFLPSTQVKVSCPNCNLGGPWTADSTQDAQYMIPGTSITGNYSISNIYNFSQPNSQVTSLRIEYTKDGYYVDKNKNNINDDSNINLLIGKSDIKLQTDNYSRTSFYYVQKDIVLKKIPPPTPTLTPNKPKPTATATAKISPVAPTNPLPAPTNPPGQASDKFDLQGTIDDYALKSVSGLKVKVTDNTGKTYQVVSTNAAFRNVSIPDITYYENRSYTLTIEDPAKKYQFLDKSAGVFKNPLSFQFSSHEVIFLPNSSKGFFEFDLQAVSKTLLEKKIRFISAVDGSPVDLTKQDLRFDLGGLAKADNVFLDCQIDGAKLDSTDLAKATWIITLDNDCYSKIWTFSGDFSALNFKDARRYISIDLGKTDFIVIPNNNPYAIYCEKFHGIDFCSYQVNRAAYFTDDNRLYFSLAASLMNHLYDSLHMAYPDVWIDDLGLSVAGYASSSNDINMGNFNSKNYICFTISELRAPIRTFVGTLFHESGHIADFDTKLRGVAPKLSWALDAIRQKDKNGKDCPSKYPKYFTIVFRPWEDTQYAATNTDEMWAEFFARWALEKFYQDGTLEQRVDALAGDTQNVLMDKQCKDAYLYLYSLLRQTFPDVNGFLNISLGISSASQTASSLESATNLNDFMSKAGFKVIPRTNVNTAFPVAQMGLTTNQILNGDFIKSNYQKLSPTQQIKMQINVWENQASQAIASNQTYQQVRAALQNFNDKIDNLLSKIGIHLPGNEYSGVLMDQDGFVKGPSGLQVKIGNKTAITDQNGKFTIRRFDKNQPILVRDANIGKNYLVTASAYTSNSLNKIQIKRAKYQVTGKVIDWGDPLSNGTIHFLNYKDVKLDDKGTFNTQLVEGKYQIKIEDNNGKEKNIVSAGNFGSAQQAIVTNSFDSLIQVH